MSLSLKLSIIKKSLQADQRSLKINPSETKLNSVISYKEMQIQALQEEIEERNRRSPIINASSFKQQQMVSNTIAT